MFAFAMGYGTLWCMETVAILSDIHGNMDALTAVLEDIDCSRVKEVHCLGDNIGYGPEPDLVVASLLDRGIDSVLGNHELAATRPAYLEWFNPIARQSLQMSMEWLQPKHFHYLEALEPFRVVHDARLVHGFPPDSPLTYLFQMYGRKVRKAMETMEESLCFVGHTHELEIICFDGQSVSRERLSQGKRQLNPAHRYIVNAGSVGQPRDGDNSAKYLLWCPEEKTLETRFVSYDARSAADKILRAGLPSTHAYRLL